MLNRQLVFIAYIILYIEGERKLPISYLPYSSGIEFGTQYLTKEASYFLGNIFSSNESIRNNGRLYWIAPVRYNYGYASELQIEQHLEFVKTMSAPMGAQTLSADVIRGTPLDSGKFRLPGFGSFFKSDGLESLVAAIPGLKSALFLSSWEVQQAFLVGVFDGRGSIDINKKNHSIRYIVLDCPTNDIGKFLFEVCTNAGFNCNYNEARDRLEGGKPRKPQLRIRNSDDFMMKVGLISPKRFSVVQESYMFTKSRYRINERSDILPGLKTIVGE